MIHQRFKTEKEKLKFKQILEGILKLSTKELLAYWMDQEVKEAEMYHRLYTMSKEVNWDEQVSKLFLDMYKDCLEHAETLLKLYRTTYPNEEVIMVDLPALEVELSEEQLRDLVYHGRLRGILEHLMETEKIARDVYEYLSKQTTDEEIKDTLIPLFG
ncbi:ferritin family protein [Thermococcus aggregans]|uniref:Ferritin family protein n=1 Tax=Thermococcus aggregans TaxID=110163 RepID=A0A9E7SR77_THEAG|nr:ferritin family protein [Thermococcus aggregans]USS41727.1 ferritin family protein [Thermococcus aggregans]